MRDSLSPEEKVKVVQQVSGHIRKFLKMAAEHGKFSLANPDVRESFTAALQKEIDWLQSNAEEEQRAIVIDIKYNRK